MIKNRTTDEREKYHVKYTILKTIHSKNILTTGLNGR